MIQAHEKRKENIIEYLLYMWQIEDLIRANQLDIELIKKNLIPQYQPKEIQANVTQWYEELIDMMRSEGVQKSGHIQLNKNTVIALTDLHLQLLKLPKEMVYGASYYKTLPYIVQLRAKSGGEEVSEIETCLTAVYGYLLLKMQEREISKETEEGIRQIMSFLSLLASKYKEDSEGLINWEEE